jgi:hypothetical protein
MPSDVESPGWRACLPTLAVIAIAYSLTCYGGTRSPDEEVVFRAAESLAAGQGLTVPQELETWTGFGTAKGKDGRSYPVFGPGESIALAPAIALVERTGWSERLGQPPAVSIFVEQNVLHFLKGFPPTAAPKHAVRFLTSFFNVVVSVLAAWVFWQMAWLLSRASWIASATTLAYALGTLAWSFSTTLFSEPLLTLSALTSLWALMRCDRRLGATTSRTGAWLLVSGLALGWAVMTHVTGVLFIPFFGLYVLVVTRDRERSRGEWLKTVAPFALGLAIPLLWLGWYNFARFGSVFETGRTAEVGAAAKFGYGHFVSPIRGLSGFFFGAGRSLFVYAPPVLLGLLSFPALLRRHRALGWLLMGAALTRLLFVASRSDWHGGSSPGPRLLMAMVPLLVLPIAASLAERVEQGWRRWVFGTVTVAGIASQAYLCVGEFFTYYLLVAEANGNVGVRVHDSGRIYLEWQFTPFGAMHAGFTGPWLFNLLQLPNLQAWGLLTVLVVVASALAVRSALRREAEAPVVVVTP